jgi:hypothetical protein
MESSHVLAAISKGELKGAPGLAFETWDPSNQSPLATPTLLLIIRSEGSALLLLTNKP